MCLRLAWWCVATAAGKATIDIWMLELRCGDGGRPARVPTIKAAPAPNVTGASAARSQRRVIFTNAPPTRGRVRIIAVAEGPPTPAQGDSLLC
jgi:hypothetical protein